jgi:hypothetical protein
MENDLFRRLFRDAAPRPTRRDDMRASGAAGLTDDDEPDMNDPYVHARVPLTPRGLHNEDQVALPGGGQASTDDLTSLGLMTPDLAAKGIPSDVRDYGRDTTIRSVPSTGIEEDQVALPGGGMAAIDDLEESGAMTSDLMRKARPEVWQAEEAQLPPFQASLRGHSGPALDRYSTFSGATSHLGGDRDRIRADLYGNARDEAAMKGVALGPMQPYGLADDGVAVTRPPDLPYYEIDPVTVTQWNRDQSAARGERPVDTTAVREADPEELQRRQRLFGGMFSR